MPGLTLFGREWPGRAPAPGLAVPGRAGVAGRVWLDALLPGLAFPGRVLPGRDAEGFEVGLVPGRTVAGCEGVPWGRVTLPEEVGRDAGREVPPCCGRIVCGVREALLPGRDCVPVRVDVALPPVPPGRPWACMSDIKPMLNIAARNEIASLFILSVLVLWIQRREVLCFPSEIITRQIGESLMLNRKYP